MGLNEDAFRALNGAGNPFLDPVMIALGVVGLLYIALLWSVPLWLGRRRREAVDLLLLLLIDAALVLVLKRAFDVPRPSAVMAVRFLPVPLDDISDASFPSGHATRAFAAALFLTLRGRDWRWGVPLFAYASLIAVSRVYVGAHWPSDVIGGAVLGVAWAYGFERLTRASWYAGRRDRIVERLARLRRKSPA